MTRRVTPLLVLFCLVGCGQSIKTLPVSGKVTLADGAPLKGGRIEFRSDAEATKGINAQGEIDEQGNYRVSTWRDGKELAGAVAGPHTVVVLPPDVVVPSQLDKPRPESPIPPRYRTYADTP